MIPPKQRKRVKKISDAKSSKPRRVVSNPPKEPTFTVARAVDALRNNEVRTTSEVKSSLGKATTETKVAFPSELLAAFRGMFGSSRTYLFQMHQVLTVSSSAGGGVLGFTAISPSIASYGEWAALSALFDEAKAVSTNIRWGSAILPSATAAPFQMAVDEQDLSTDPVSYLSVYRLANSKNFTHPQCEGGSGMHKQSHRFASREWCAVSVPYSTSPIGGFIGCWVYANGSLLPASTAMAVVSSITVGKFRCRA
jgi:hypothetical protein